MKNALVPLAFLSALVCLSTVPGCTGTQKIAKSQTNAQKHLDNAKTHLEKAKDAYEAASDPRPEIENAEGEIDAAKADIRTAQEQAPHIQDKNTGILAGIEGLGKWIINAGLIAIALGIIYLLIRYGWLLPRRRAVRDADILLKVQDPQSNVTTDEAVAAIRGRNPLIDAAMSKRKGSS
ncbi:MAG: hypothetical protein R3348_09750 [Xanthomonadales bacterium]|nr:hypothetical protein [Xanthomonadales bacterium]